MKREAKNLQSRQKIVAAALQEFSGKSFAEASLNTICSDGEISKGIIYHYFKDKDELYLVCVQECLEALTAYLRIHAAAGGGPIKDCLQRYFDARLTFFDQNPQYLQLFCSAVLLPPPHLASAIGEIRRDFDTLSVSILTTLLEGVHLRTGITMDEAIQEFRQYQDFVNTRYQAQTIRQVDLREHEQRCSRTLEILLYGLVEREG